VTEQSPGGMKLDEYLSMMLRLMNGALTAGYGVPVQVTIFAGAQSGQGMKMVTTLTDDQLLLMLTGFCEHMVLKHANPSGEA